jgi:threonine dehydrogenase-like Zn-dependent dehydrogenase
MLALVFDGDARMQDIPIPDRQPGEALIRVLSAGICNTDIEILRGYMEFNGIPGHEFVGIVEESDNKDLRGKRVVGEINCPCGRCRLCRLEMPHHCRERSVLGIHNRNGAFAEYLTLPDANLLVVPGSIPDDVAVFTEPTAAACRIPEQITISPEDRIIVLGDGKLGLLVAQVLWLHSKHLVCVGKHPEKAEILQKLRIATAHCGEPIEGGADIVVDATGSRDGLGCALQLVRPEGTVVLKTIVADTAALDLTVPVIDEVTILGSRCGPFRPALEALILGNVEVRPMITETFPLSEAPHALKRAADPDVLKVVLHM